MWLCLAQLVFFLWFLETNSVYKYFVLKPLICQKEVHIFSKEVLKSLDLTFMFHFLKVPIICFVHFLFNMFRNPIRKGPRYRWKELCNVWPVPLYYNTGNRDIYEPTAGCRGYWYIIVKQNGKFQKKSIVIRNISFLRPVIKMYILFSHLILHKKKQDGIVKTLNWHLKYNMHYFHDWITEIFHNREISL